jgi:hypothetical protein
LEKVCTSDYILFYSTAGEGSVDNCLETGTFDMDWSQPEIKVSSKKSVEKSRNIVDESANDEIGLDWSRPLADPVAKVDDELELEWSDDPDTEEEDLPMTGSGIKKTGSFKKTVGKSNSKTIEGKFYSFRKISKYIYSVRRLIGSLWADIKAITITE